jgi:hypothetical protein
MPRTLRALALSFLVLATAAAAPVAGQGADPEQERAAVMAVVTRLFDGMRAGDSAMVRSVFHPKANLATALVRQGNAMVQMEAIEEFVKAVGTPHTEVWDERIRNPEVRIDGTLASVWVEYSFYVDTRFSHCGIDAFHLAKDGTAWKIVALADTRRRQGCPDQG